jgi:hypothetical protein
MREVKERGKPSLLDQFKENGLFSDGNSLFTN